MGKVLYIDACVRRERSRTERLAQRLLSELGHEDVETIVLENAGIMGMDSESLDRRDRFIAEGDFSDPMFDHAKRFMEADVVVIAAPFWESSFPSTLKAYLEVISIPRLVYRYNEKGYPEGNCNGRVFYVTTRGGPVTDDQDLGARILEVSMKTYGMKSFDVISANNLDIVGNDVDAILDDAMSRIPSIISKH